MKVVVVLFLAAAICCCVWYFSPKARMILGGVFADLAYWSQDGVAQFDERHAHPSPEEVWSYFIAHNKMAAKVRKLFPRTAHHPMMAIVTCMDGRLDTNELMGDTRRFYYVVRTAGSVIDPKEEEMLELAVRNGVKVVTIFRHTDCAAEKVASDPERSKLFPEITRAISERDMRVREFLSRPFIAEQIASRQLLVKIMDIDTMTEEALPHTETGSVLTHIEPPTLRAANQ